MDSYCMALCRLAGMRLSKHRRNWCTDQRYPLKCMDLHGAITQYPMPLFMAIYIVIAAW